MALSRYVIIRSFPGWESGWIIEVKDNSAPGAGVYWDVFDISGRKLNKYMTPPFNLNDSKYFRKLAKNRVLEFNISVGFMYVTCMNNKYQVFLEHKYDTWREGEALMENDVLLCVCSDRKSSIDFIREYDELYLKYNNSN